MAAVVLNSGDKPVAFQLQHREQALVSTTPPHTIQTYLFAPRGSGSQTPGRAGALAWRFGGRPHA